MCPRGISIRRYSPNDKRTLANLVGWLKTWRAIIAEGHAGSQVLAAGFVFFVMRRGEQRVRHGEVILYPNA